MSVRLLLRCSGGGKWHVVSGFRIRWVQEVERGLEELRDGFTEVSGEELAHGCQNVIQIHNRKYNSLITPLPIRNGLNPSRVMVPRGDFAGGGAVKSQEFLEYLISTQNRRHPDDNAEAIRERFARGEVTDDRGRALSPDDRLLPGQFINFYRQPAPEREVPGALGVLYRDQDLVVVDKPPFLSTLPRGQHITQTALVRARIQLGIPELSPSHRLDRLTRGVLMFTARPEVRGAYQTMFDRREATKIYEAITPVPEDAPFRAIDEFRDWAEWDLPTERRPWRLKHHMVKIRGRLSTYLTNAEPNAVTFVEGIERRRVQPEGRDVLVWRLRPATGKTHQLRVAMRTLGLPLVNDPLYEDVSDEALWNPEAALPSPVFVEDEDFSKPMGLVAKELQFIDPLSGKRRKFVSNY